MKRRRAVLKNGTVPYEPGTPEITYRLNPINESVFMSASRPAWCTAIQAALALNGRRQYRSLWRLLRRFRSKRERRHTPQRKPSLGLCARLAIDADGRRNQLMIGCGN